jgi:hypothetical protein
MGDVRRTVEYAVDTVAAISLDDGAAAGFGVFFDDVAEVAKGGARFDGGDGEGEAFPRGFDEFDEFLIGEGFVADVVGFVQVTVVAFVVEGYVKIEDVAVEEDAAVGNAVADYFVGGGADGLREVVVVEGGGVGLRMSTEVVYTNGKLTFRSKHALCTISSR